MPDPWRPATCQRCGDVFACGAALPADSPCWCAALPPLPAPMQRLADGTLATCLCRSCLASALTEIVGAAP